MSKNFLFIVISIMLVFGVSSCANPATVTNSNISVEQAEEIYSAGGAFFLDVREVDEWNQGHIKGATLIPLGELEQRYNELPKDQPIVVYCRSGNRSLTGRDILLEAGFEDVVSMDGGIIDWAQSGFPIE
ncbi:MAG TPA: rhodanese-like domain-containing protein [Anaerolineales bacterium]|nr:rhodanese-like domain-containing protein [Anaerolineales bacterium]